MTTKEKIFIFGASGHAKVVIDIVERQGGYEIAFLIDDDPALKGKEIFGYRVFGNCEDLLQSKETHGITGCVVAIGNNAVRERLDRRLRAEGFCPVSVVHPSALISRGASIGEGSAVMAGAVINADARIGRGVIVNTGATIDHDCVVEDFVHIAPGVKLCGNVRVGERALIGVGTAVISNIIIGKDVTVGAGSTVIRDVRDGLTVMGSPAQIKENRR